MRTNTLPRNPNGFTLIEILVVIGMIAILASIVLIAINPLRQFALARNAQRQSDVNAILNAIGARIAEHQGIFADNGSCQPDLPFIQMTIGSGGINGNYDLRPCLVPTYISELPLDPEFGRNSCTTAECDEPSESYDTNYMISKDATNGRITVCALAAEEEAIPGSEAYCLTR